LRPSRSLLVHVFLLTALRLAGLALLILLALLAAALLTPLLAALALLSALALAALALLTLLTLLTALAALSGTVHVVISHGKFSSLVDRGCAPRKNRSDPDWFLVPSQQMIGIALKFCCSRRRDFRAQSFSCRVSHIGKLRAGREPHG